MYPSCNREKFRLDAGYIAPENSRSSSDRLRCLFEEQRQDEKSQGADEASPCKCSGGSTPQPPGVDKSCQAGDASAFADIERAGDAQIVSLRAPLACKGGCANSATNESSVAASTAAVVEEEVERRMVPVLAAAATAEGGAATWANAFFSARQLIHTALLSLFEHTTTLLGAEGGSKHALVEILSKRLEGAGSNSPGAQESNAVVPWVPGETNTEASTALEVLQDGVKSTIEGIRSALAGHATRTVPQATAVSTAVQHATTASQTEKEREIVELQKGVDFGQEVCTRRCTGGVEIGEPDERSSERSVGAGGADAAPAWEGGRSGWGSFGRKSDGDRERRRQLPNDAMVEELKQKSDVLSEALQRAETEKEDLKRSLTQRFERQQVRVWRWSDSMIGVSDAFGVVRKSVRGLSVSTWGKVTALVYECKRKHLAICAESERPAACEWSTVPAER